MSVIDVEEDLVFDARLPVQVRRQSPSHFTPVEVARYAAALFTSEREQAVLDVGAGAGKFCIVAAAQRPNVTFVGVERRGHLVDIATRLAAEWKLPNARFVHGDAFDLDWSMFDAFYFYNPFGEHLFETTIGRSFSLDDTIDLHRDHFDRYVAMTLERLAAAREGTRVITYHGLGADLPSTYERLGVERIGSDSVELWEQARSHHTRPYRRVDDE